MKFSFDFKFSVCVLTLEVILRGHYVFIAMNLTNLSEEILGRGEIGVADGTTKVADGLLSVESPTLALA